MPLLYFLMLAARTKLREKLKKAGNILTNSKLFQKKINAAWEACDTDGSGAVNKDRLYAGILYIHLKLAENAGSAACHPPSRQVCDKLFEAADADKSGSVDRKEFGDIVVILCGQLLKRMIVYYAFMIVLVPIASITLVRIVGAKTRLPSGTIAEKLAEQVTTGFLSSQVLPYFWNKIDDTAQKKMTDKAASIKGNKDE